MKRSREKGGKGVPDLCVPRKQICEPSYKKCHRHIKKFKNNCHDQVLDGFLLPKS